MANNNTKGNTIEVSKKRLTKVESSSCDCCTASIEFNFVLYDQKHALSLFQRSNPAISHMLQSQTVYFEPADVSSGDTPEAAAYRRIDKDIIGPMREINQRNASRRVLVQSTLQLAKRNMLNYIVDQKNCRVKVYLYLLQHLLFVKWIFLAFKSNSVELKQKLPPLELDVLLCQCCDSALVRSIAGRLLKAKRNWADADNELMVPRNDILDIYCLSLYRKLLKWSHLETPPYNQLDLGPLDDMFLTAVQCANVVRPSPRFATSSKIT